MKKLLIFSLLFSAILFSGCEDAISVDTDTAAPRLVVDALLTWQKGTAGNVQTIKLSTTTNYFSETVPVVSGATVFVENSLGTTFDFLETPNTGIYVCGTFIPQIGENYKLTVIYNGKTITANETQYAVAPIDFIQQKLSPGFGGEEDLIEVRTFFTDPAFEQNYYMSKYQSNIEALPDFDISDDEYYNGNQFFALYINEDLKPGNTLNITLYGISRRYSEYMTKILNVTENSGPFSTPPATVRGNLVNNTNPDDFVLGYFSLSETDTQNYVVE